MKCLICGSEAVIHLSYLKKDFCAKHFSRLIRKRFMRNLKNNSMWEKNQSIFVPRGNELRAAVISHLFKGKHFIKTKKGNADRIVRKECMDDVSSAFLRTVFSGKWPKFRISSRDIYPLYNIPYPELKVFADCNNLTYHEKKPKQDDFLNKMTGIRPGAMFSIVRWLE